MKVLSIGFLGASTLATTILNMLYDLGHNVVVLAGSGRELVTAAEELGIQRHTAKDTHIAGLLDVIVVFPESMEKKLPKDGTLIKLSLADVFVNTERHGGVVWKFCTNDQQTILAQGIYKFGDEICGANIVGGIEQLAADLLINSINNAAKTNGLWPDAVATTLPPSWSTELNMARLSVWHKSNETVKEYSEKGSIVHSFTAAATRYASRTALIDENNVITYRELYDRAVSISQEITEIYAEKGLSLDNETLIGVALPKSARLYATILGILGAGCAYVPFDITHPQERLRAIAADSKLDYIICDSNYDSGLFSDEGVQPLIIPEFSWSPDMSVDVSAFPSAELLLRDTSRLAVVIYTSGSTGRPKGVMLEHRNLLNLCEWYRHHVELTEESRPFQFSTIAFDASILDIFPTLLSGASLIIPSEADRHDFLRLDELVRTHEVTHAFLPPALLAALPDFVWPTLKHLVTGGDVCDPDTISKWSASRKFHNIYGPTECTVLATTVLFSDGSYNRNIGKPISNAGCYILDEQFKPVSTGEEGELYIRGRGVGRGYNSEKKLTEERFLRDPFSGEPSTIMYKTGDIVKWRDDGNIEFIGRQDTQVKIRGFRVELGEIENAILDTRTFRHCAVVVDGSKRIRAFVAKPYNEGADTETVKQALCQVLPEYMIPRFIIVLDELPFTDNGKINRNSLAGMDISTSLVTDDELTETENRLLEIWALVLDIDTNEIGKNDSFFDLGGHSLLVSRMILAVKNSFQGNATLARFMERPTIAALASLLTDSTLKKGAQISEAVYADMILNPSISPVGEENPFLRKPKAVLLTGANGFLGTYLLEQLLRNTNAVVYCLVRGSSQEEAEQKLALSLLNNRINYRVDNKRIQLVVGDLEKPLLGLDISQFEKLSLELDAIYHNGAHVNHVYDYKYLFNANVRSTLDILHLATHKKNKSVHYISTLSAASKFNEAGQLIEDGPAEISPAFVNNGYNLTKWVSEHLVWQAISRGIDATIVRPGNISGHSLTGLCQPDKNRILLVLKGSAQLGIAPAWDATFDLCPVDFLAKAIINCTLSDTRDTKVLHFHNPTPLDWTTYVMSLTRIGYEIQLVDPGLWRSRLLDIDESNALYNVVSFYLDENNEDIGDISSIEHSRTESTLQKVGMTYPKKDNALIDRNLSYLVDCGFLPLPRQPSTERSFVA